MTPFALKIRDLRRQHGMTQKQLAARLGLSAAYLSALEHGHRGQPSRELVHHMCAIFGLIWEQADELHHLADLSHPRVVIDTSGLPAPAMRMANTLAACVRTLSAPQIQAIEAIIQPDLQEALDADAQGPQGSEAEESVSDWE